MSQALEFQKLDWQKILLRLGVPPESIQNPRRLGPCPIEGQGNTRFRMSNRYGRGDWICNHCGSGDGVRLVALLRQCSDTEAIWYLKSEEQPTLSPIEIEKRLKGPSQKDINKRRRRLQQTWDATKPVAVTDPVWSYLTRRIPKLRPEWISCNVKFADNLYHFDEGSQQATKRPAMVARVASRDGNPVNLHRTYLRKDGFKADVSPDQQKKLMTGVGVLGGATIRLNKSTGDHQTLCITEGIETGYAIVAACQNKFDVESAINAGNLPKVIVPKTYKRVVLYLDRDEVNPKTGWRPGEHFGGQLATRLRSEGFEVIVKVPEEEGVDFCDLWFQRHA